MKYVSPFLVVASLLASDDENNNDNVVDDNIVKYVEGKLEITENSLLEQVDDRLDTFKEDTYNRCRESVDDVVNDFKGVYKDLILDQFKESLKRQRDEFANVLDDKVNGFRNDLRILQTSNNAHVREFSETGRVARLQDQVTFLTYFSTLPLLALVYLFIFKEDRTISVDGDSQDVEANDRK